MQQDSPKPRSSGTKKSQPQKSAGHASSKQAAPQAKSQASPDTLLAVIRLRGSIRVPVYVEQTLHYLRLIKNHSCVVVKNTPPNRGMLQKAKDYITWGEISKEVYDELLQKRGEKHPDNPEEMKKFFRLAPPRGGLERKGLKHTFTAGGSLGYRGEHINTLLKKMM